MVSISKYTILCLYFIFLSLFSVQADCMHVEVEPQCMINGKTKISSCSGRSDSSGWKIPVAYDGNCRETKELPLSTKEYIDKHIISYFSPYVTNYSYNIDGVYGDTFIFVNIPDGAEYYMTILDYEDGLESEGTILVDAMYDKISEMLYERYTMEITEQIEWEMSVLHYVSSVIGYDYVIRKRIK